MVWITNIFKDGYNCMIFDDITEDIFLDTAVNESGKVKAELLQDTIQKDHITRAI